MRLLLISLFLTLIENSFSLFLVFDVGVILLFLLFLSQLAFCKMICELFIWCINNKL